LRDGGKVSKRGKWLEKTGRVVFETVYKTDYSVRSRSMLQF